MVLKMVGSELMVDGSKKGSSELMVDGSQNGWF